MLRVASLDVQSETIHLDLVGYNESAQVRGSDIVLPTVAGRLALPRVRDVYRFVLQGYVRGVGVDRDARALSWRTATDQLMAVLDLSLPADEVTVGPDEPAQFPNASPYLGLTGDHTIMARCVSMARGPVQSHMSFQSWSFEMECVTNPPLWEATSGSSP